MSSDKYFLIMMFICAVLIFLTVFLAGGKYDGTFSNNCCSCYSVHSLQNGKKQ